MKRAAIVVLPLALVAMAVARVGAPASAEAAVKQALARTVDARSSRFTLSSSSSESPSGNPYKVEGLMDYASHRGRITYWQDTEVIFDGDVTYMKWPVPWRNDATWLRYYDGGNNTDPLDLQERALSNPTGLLKFLRGAGNDVHEVGSEEIRATRTTHYEGTLDLQKVVDQAPVGDRADLQVLLDFMREDEPTMVPFGLWVDSGGVAHRLRIDQGQGMSMLVEYYDFGIPVEITPPPPSEIISIEDFMKELEAHAGDSTCGNSDAGYQDAVVGSESVPQSEGDGSSLSETHSEDPAVLNLSGDICVISFSVGAKSTSLGGG
jgi:hypothetical protein